MFVDFPAEGWQDLEQSDNGHFVMELLPREPVVCQDDDIIVAGALQALANDNGPLEGLSKDKDTQSLVEEDGPDSDSPSSSSSGSHAHVPSDSEGEYVWFAEYDCPAPEEQCRFSETTLPESFTELTETLDAYEACFDACAIAGNDKVPEQVTQRRAKRSGEEWI